MYVYIAAWLQTLPATNIHVKELENLEHRHAYLPTVPTVPTHLMDDIFHRQVWACATDLPLPGPAGRVG